MAALWPSWRKWIFDGLGMARACRSQTQRTVALRRPATLRDATPHHANQTPAPAVMGHLITGQAYVPKPVTLRNALPRIAMRRGAAPCAPLPRSAYAPWSGNPGLHHRQPYAVKPVTPSQCPAPQCHATHRPAKPRRAQQPHAIVSRSRSNRHLTSLELIHGLRTDQASGRRPVQP